MKKTQLDTMSIFAKSLLFHAISSYLLFMAHSSLHRSTCPGSDDRDDRDGGNCGWVNMYIYVYTSSERNWGKDSPEHCRVR